MKSLANWKNYERYVWTDSTTGLAIRLANVRLDVHRDGGRLFEEYLFTYEPELYNLSSPRPERRIQLIEKVTYQDFVTTKFYLATRKRKPTGKKHREMRVTLRSPRHPMIADTYAVSINKGIDTDYVDDFHMPMMWLISRSKFRDKLAIVPKGFIDDILYHLNDPAREMLAQLIEKNRPNEDELKRKREITDIVDHIFRGI